MSRVVATHNGPFHADDVLSWALLLEFVCADFVVCRTRDPARLSEAEIVFDVGGQYSPVSGRFDHHQAHYSGDLSSAGMVLSWLIECGRLPAALGTFLKVRLVDYVDAVDTGRQTPVATVPCFATIVQAFSNGCETMQDFDLAFLQAGTFARTFVCGLVQGYQELEAGRGRVKAAMDEAVRLGSRVMILDRYCKWKEPYFDYGGEDHPTDYVLFPSNDESWRIVGIPPVLGVFSQKRPLPATWAGLMGEALERVVGVSGARFCHKNLFIAVFDSRESADEVIRRYGLDHPA